MRQYKKCETCGKVLKNSGEVFTVNKIIQCKSCAYPPRNTTVKNNRYFNNNTKGTTVPLYINSSEGIVGYQIEHRYLRNLFYTQTESLVECCKKAGSRFLFDLYTEVYRSAGVQPTFSLQDFVFEPIVDNYMQLHLLCVLPSPQYQLLCYRIHMLMDKASGCKRYYTIERGSEGGFLCFWDQDGNHFNCRELEQPGDNSPLFVSTECVVISNLFEDSIKIERLKGNKYPYVSFVSLLNKDLKIDIHMTGNMFYIGRGIGNDFVLNNNYIARRHAILLREGSNVSIVECGAANGIFVNGTRMERHSRRLLQIGDVISFATIKEYYFYYMGLFFD